MADKISVSYDANIDDMKRKLDELIAKNKELSAYATAAAKALSNIASAQGLSTINNINNSFNTTVNVLAQVNTNLTQVNAQVNKTTNNLTQVNAQLNNTTNNVTRMGSAVNNASRQVSGFDAGIGKLGKGIIAAFSVQTLINFGKELIQLEREFEMIQNRMNFVFDTADRGEAGFNRLRNLSMRLGLDVKETANAFSTFGIAAKMAGFSSEDSEKIFTKVAVSLRGAGANSLQASRAFYALQQMLSKGVVSAEELRRQLGESLPGASDLMAEAYQRLHPEANMTNATFNKLLESGKILSAEVLPEFASVLEETFSPAVAAKMTSLDAAINRLSNGFDALKLSILNARAVSGTINALGGYFDDLGVVIRSNLPTYQKIAEVLLAIIPNLGTVSGTAKILRGIEAEIQRMDDFANKERDEYIKSVANRFLALTDGNFAKAIQAQGRLLREEMKKSTKDLSEEEKKQRELRIENARLVLSELNKMQTQAESSFQDNKEAEEKAALDARKAEIAASKELLAAEETRLFKTTEGTVEYYNQLIKTIKARMDLIKVEKRDTPEAMGLDLAKQEKDLKQAERMIASFIQKMPKISFTEVALDGYIIKLEEIPEILEEGVYVPSVEALQKLSKEIKDLTAQRLEDVVAAIETEIEFHEEGTDRRLELEKALVMAKARLAAKNAEIQGKSVKEIEAIFAKANIEMQKLDTDFNDGKKKEAEDYAEFYKRLQDGLDGYEGNSLDKRLKAIRQYYGKLIAEAKVYGRTKEEIDALTANRDKALFEENVKEVGKFVNTAGDLYGQFTQLQEMEFNNQKTALDNKLAQGLISEEQYNAELADIEKKQFEQNKKTQKVNVLINSASAIVRAFSELGPIGGALAAFAIGAMAIKQMSLIDSAQFPEGFKEGVIDLNGPGTGTSDSIPARLSRGESVMTADETKRYKPVLQAIRDNNFEEFVSKRYIDAMSGTKRSFADNVGASIELNNFEMIDAIRKNKSVKIANWDDFDKVLRKPRTAHKVHRRRAW
jgi:tape measure domain-containing protein